jgi:regulatory GntR family protein
MVAQELPFECTSQRARRSRQLGEDIEERIVTGPYPPATRLDAPEPAIACCVSRTPPVREALIELASAGLVEIRARRGVEDFIHLGGDDAALEGDGLDDGWGDVTAAGQAGGARQALDAVAGPGVPGAAGDFR